MKILSALALAGSVLSAPLAYADVIDYGKLPVTYSQTAKTDKSKVIADIYGVKKTPNTYRFVNSYIVNISRKDSSEVGQNDVDIDYRDAPEIISSSVVRKFTHVSKKDADKGNLWNIGKGNTHADVSLTKEGKSVSWVDGSGQDTTYLEDDHTKIAYDTSVSPDSDNPNKLHVHLTFVISRDANHTSSLSDSSNTQIQHTYNQDEVVDTSEARFVSGNTFGYTVPVTFNIFDAGDSNNKLPSHSYVAEFMINAYSQDGEAKAESTSVQEPAKTKADKKIEEIDKSNAGNGEADELF